MGKVGHEVIKSERWWLGARIVAAVPATVQHSLDCSPGSWEAEAE